MTGVIKSIDITTLLRDDLKHLKPYLPDRNKSILTDAQRDQESWVDSNENPHTKYGRYPDLNQTKLKNQVAELKNINASEILFSHGSDEAIDLVVRAFCMPTKDRITVVMPGFEMYQHAANLSAISVREIRQRAPFQFDQSTTDEILGEQNKILFLCSPNNPTGASINDEHLIQLLDGWDGLIVLDEAYIDFAPYPSRIAFLNKYQNLIVLQTFSKAWGLAGLRIGMTFANAEIIKALNAIKIPYNVSQFSIDQASKVLENVDAQDKVIERWKLEKTRMIEALKKCNTIEHIYSSDANFLLVECQDSESLYHHLLANGVYTRFRKEIECLNCLRISIGSMEENKKCIEAIQSFINK